MERLAREVLNQIAAEQRGLFSAAQAVSSGMTRGQLARALSSGTIRRVRRGVYAIEGTVPSPWENVVSAALAVGPQAVVSHESAALVHRFEYAPADRAVVEITVLEQGSGCPPGVVAHRSGDLTADDIVRKRGVLVTSPCRTLVDLAGRLGPVLTEKTLDEGLIKRRWTVADVQACLGRARPNLAGRGYVEKLLSLRAEDPSADSELEARVFRVLQRFAPFEPHFPVVLGGHVYVLDAAWPERMAAVEIVGRSHRLASRSAFDRERDKLNDLTHHGWRIVHLTATMSDAKMIAIVEGLLGFGAAPSYAALAVPGPARR